jgi:hypothetical protein
MARNFNRRRLPHVFAWRKAVLRYGRVVFISGLLTLVAAGGCQRGPTWNLAPVEGTVTKGGRPLPGIQVVFLPDTDAGMTGPRSSGRTDATGHYRLRADNGEDGVVIGKHRVLTLDPQAPKGGPMGATARPPQLPERAKRLLEQQKTAGDGPRVPPSYEQFKETPLRAEVRPASSSGSGPQILDFQIP